MILSCSKQNTDSEVRVITKFIVPEITDCIEPDPSLASDLTKYKKEYLDSPYNYNAFLKNNIVFGQFVKETKAFIDCVRNNNALFKNLKLENSDVTY